ncbi:MAG TPA: MarR family transcriptional regulator [Gemmatimonadaceae bacterium]
MHRHSTAAVLFHRAVADTLGLGPTDHKCLDLLRERGPMTGSELAAVTALTTGAVTGVVARLESAGFVQRHADPHDGRQQIVSVADERMAELEDIFGPLHKDVGALLENFDPHQLAAIGQFLDGVTDCLYRQIGLLRSRGLHAARPDARVQRQARR